MGSIRYIGSKARLTDWIMDLAGKPPAGWRVYDMFAGTGAVSSAAADQGWIVSANDALRSACQQTKARLTSAEQVPLKNLGGYQKAIELLNGLNPVEGFFYREYTDEAFAILSPEMLKEGKSIEGFDLATLQKDLETVKA